MKHVIIGTAGHVDHGKTELTRALTGTNTDCLAEEQRRGITIQIGFAQLELAHGLTASIIDVPGHERLIKNMLTGASGIDVVLFVVAADEGFMPQSQEHLDILSLLGVQAGIIVFTKADLVEPDWLEMVEADTRDRVAGTFLEGAPSIAVSSVTGAGIDELKQLVAGMVEHAAPKRLDLPFRMPVDRSFTIKGFGTVVTGTCTEGSVTVGETVEVYPERLSVRVRELQNHGISEKSSEAGMRVAANLAGVDQKQVAIGCTLAAPGTLTLTQMASVVISLTASAPFSVRNSSRVHVYAGTQETVARVRLLDRDELLPEETSWAQLTFEKPLALRNLDRFIVRFLSPLVTIGGGRVLDCHATRLRRHDAAVQERLEHLDGTLAERVAQLTMDAGTVPCSLGQLALDAVASPDELEAVLGDLEAAGKIARFGGVPFSDAAIGELKSRAVATASAYQAEHPLEAGMRAADVREQLCPSDAAIAERLLAEFIACGALEAAGDRVHTPGYAPTFTPEHERLKREIMVYVESRGLEAPTLDELEEAVPGNAKAFKQIVSHLRETGDLVFLTARSCVSHGAYQRALDMFRGMFEDADAVALGDFRTLAGVSRKYAQQILDAFDAKGISKMVGDKRILLAPREQR